MKKFYSDKKIVCFGEVLWDMLPEGNKIGGAPLNVAYHLHKLGMDAALISRVGDDALGRRIHGFIERKGLSRSILQTDTIHPTSTVEAQVLPNHEITYNIIENVAWDFIEYDHSINELITKADYLVYGSLITRNNISRNALYKILESPLIKVLDVNLRKPFYSKETLHYLLLKANIVKMNETELGLISEWFDFRGTDQEKMQALSNAFSLDILITTYGSKGAYLLYQDKISFEKGMEIKVADTVGSGDAFLAGFLSEYVVGKPPPEALKTANKMGAFIAQRTGGCPDYDIKEFHKSIKQNSIYP